MREWNSQLPLGGLNWVGKEGLWGYWGGGVTRFYWFSVIYLRCTKLQTLFINITFFDRLFSMENFFFIVFLAQCENS